MPVTAGALVTSAGFNLLIGGLCLVAFAAFRRWPLTSKCYQAKRVLGAENRSGAKAKPLPNELPYGLFGWVHPVWHYSEQEVINLCGLDVAVYFRLLRMGMRLFFWVTLWTCCVVLPVNYSGGYLTKHRHKRVGLGADGLSAAAAATIHCNSTHWVDGTPCASPLGPPFTSQKAEYLAATAGRAPWQAAAAALEHWLLLHIATPMDPASGSDGGDDPPGAASNSIWNTSSVAATDIDLLSLANVPPGSPLMWVHVASTYLITFLALKLLWNYSRDVAFQRAVFLAAQPRTGPSSTMLVTDVPGLAFGTPTQRVRVEWLRGLLPKGWGPKPAYDQPHQKHKPGSSRGASGAHASAAGRMGGALRGAMQHAAAAGGAGGTSGAAEGVSSDSSLAEPLLPVSQSASSHAGMQRSTSQQGATSSQAPMGDAGGDSGDWEVTGAGGGVVQDPWQEAVEQLDSTKGDVKALVEGEMRRVYGQDTVAAVATVHDIRGLQPVAATYNSLLQQFGDVLDWYAGQLRRSTRTSSSSSDRDQAQQQTGGDEDDVGGPATSGSPGRKKMARGGAGHAAASLPTRKVTVLGPSWGQWGIERYGVTPSRVDALEYYPQVLRHQWDLLQAEQQAALQRLPLPAAFVTFKGQLMASLASSSLHCFDETCWRIHPAPRPPEVVWASLGQRVWESSLRHLGEWALFVLLVLFYLPITAAIQAPVNMENLQKVPIISALINIPLLYRLVQGILPSLVLLLFLTVLPMLLKAVIKWGRPFSLSEIDTQLLQKYFLFQFFAVFVFSFVSGTALGQLKELIEDPGAIVPLLGIAAPQQASFFMTYLLLRGLLWSPLQLLALPQLAMYIVRVPWAVTKRQQRRLLQQQSFGLGQYIPLHTLALLLGLVFCVAAPLISPIALLYFVTVNLTQRYQWLYTFSHPYEGAGRMWGTLFHQVMVGVYTFIAVMGSLLGIKRFPYALLMLPLALAAVTFHALATTWLARPLTLPPSREAAAMDHKAPPTGPTVGLPDQAPGNGLVEQPEEGGVDDLYLPPALLLNRGEMDDLIAEAEAIQQQLREGHVPI